VVAKRRDRTDECVGGIPMRTHLLVPDISVTFTLSLFQRDRLMTSCVCTPVSARPSSKWSWTCVPRLRKLNGFPGAH